MSYRTVFHPKAKIFDKAGRGQEFKNLVSRNAKKFKQGTKEKMIRGPHTGALYDRKRGPGFTRAHRASRRGQRPSPDTMTLVNAVSDRKLNETSVEVYIAERVNPDNGALASNYAEILQTKLDRPIMTPDDAISAEKEMARDGEALIRKMI